MIRTIDLFAGVGGIRLGAEAALKKHGRCRRLGNSKLGRNLIDIC